MHATASATTPTTNATPGGRRLKWRIVDIVVASVIGVAIGVVFWAYGVIWGPISAPISAFLPGLQAAPAALWLVAGVIGGLIIRKPGAAMYTELVAAVVSALIGSQWGGLLTIEAGLVQGLGAELIFAIFLYRRWGFPVAVLAGAVAGLAMAINDLVLWYAGSAPAFATIYVVSGVVGGAVIAGGLGWLAVRGLARTGALSRFASGRDAVRVTS
ncbi:ECF transporter S component [Agromyces aerolatus]|uniref:ECF transporter S component n=1 Tax=Agromyces sp. LY-1074 TaxID=3074080 RepID=UPI0028648230|nr:MULTISPECIES: ECF transporter S component [unclassified Agromyces]MDR5699904.1 ECF transporter S component [Agromyces sp. LY-1074]MDR5706284.1 ECF transporter S component [Agromyces sp. LY-1358]